MKIPDVVLQEASEIMEMLEGTLVYLGKIGDGRDVFLFKQPIDAETGFPFVYLYDGINAMEITGFDALDIINEVEKNRVSFPHLYKTSMKQNLVPVTIFNWLQSVTDYSFINRNAKDN